MHNSKPTDNAANHNIRLEQNIFLLKHNNINKIKDTIKMLPLSMSYIYFVLFSCAPSVCIRTDCENISLKDDDWCSRVSQKYQSPNHLY